MRVPIQTRVACSCLQARRHRGDQRWTCSPDTPASCVRVRLPNTFGEVTLTQIDCRSVIEFRACGDSFRLDS